MAQKGTFTALQKLTVDPTDYSDIGQSIVDAELKAKQDARAEAELQLKKDTAKRLADKDFEERYGISTDAILKTGFNSYDEVMLPYVASLREELWEAKKAIKLIRASGK